MEKKICRKCKEEKEICEFYNIRKSKDGKRSKCKNCINLENNLYVKKNKKKVKTIKQKYVDNNKEKVKQSKKKWFNKNPNYQNEWIINNYKNNFLFRLVNIMRSRTRLFLKSKNIKKKNTTFEIVGCSPEFLKKHLENQFTEGMNWNLFGSNIHIDHIVPLSFAETEEDAYKLCHYTNLQPLWAEDNLKKSNKIVTNSPSLSDFHNDEIFHAQQGSIIINHL